MLKVDLLNLTMNIKKIIIFNSFIFPNNKKILIIEASFKLTEHYIKSTKEIL